MKDGKGCKDRDILYERRTQALADDYHRFKIEVMESSYKALILYSPIFSESVLAQAAFIGV